MTIDPSLIRDSKGGSTPLRVPDMADAAAERPRLELEALKLRVDAYKWRADEYRSRYEGQRTLEWNAIIQTYAGYTAIALAFNYVHGVSQLRESRAVAWVAMAVTLFFYFATRYLSYRIQERLVCFDQTHGHYAQRVSEALDVDPRDPGGSLRHLYYWTYDTQLVLSTVTCSCLVAYELSSLPISGVCSGIVLFLLTVAVVVIGLVRTPTKRPKAEKKEQADPTAISMNRSC